MWIWRGAQGAVRGGGKFRRSSTGEISIRRLEADTLFKINAILRLASFVPWPILYISSHVHFILPPDAPTNFFSWYSAHLRPRLCNHDAPSRIQFGRRACTWSASTIPIHSNLLTPVDVGKIFSFWFSLMWYYSLLYITYVFLFFKKKSAIWQSQDNLKNSLWQMETFSSGLNMLMWSWWLMVLRIDSSLPLNPGPAAHLWCAADLLLPMPPPPLTNLRSPCDRWPTACQHPTIFQFPVGVWGILRLQWSSEAQRGSFRSQPEYSKVLVRLFKEVGLLFGNKMLLAWLERWKMTVQVLV